MRRAIALISSEDRLWQGSLGTALTENAASTKHIATLALMLQLGVASVYAQLNPVKMNYSGSNVATTINLQDGTVTDDELLAGNGTLGPFTYRELHADDPSQPSSSCSGPSALVVTGAGVFRFQDGSLMTVAITEGAVWWISRLGWAILPRHIRSQVEPGVSRGRPAPLR